MSVVRVDRVAEAAALLAELGARGLYLRPLPDGRIGARPPELLDAETVERIRAMRAPILEALSRPTWPCVRCQGFAFDRPTVCYWCRRAEGRPAHA